MKVPGCDFHVPHLPDGMRSETMLAGEWWSRLDVSPLWGLKLLPPEPLQPVLQTQAWRALPSQGVAGR